MLEQLRQFFSERTKFFQSRFQRTLPFGDIVVDRWEKAKLLGFGDGSSIYDSGLVLGNVKVGEQTWIGPQVVLDGSGGGLTIGSHCNISAGVQIYTHDTLKRALSGGRAEVERSPTRIGSNTYLGPNVVIAKGVSIGSHVVIGANSLVLKDIPDGMVAFGTPAKIIGQSEKYLD